VYLWIDYCCLPQDETEGRSERDAVEFEAGLKAIADVVKSCDLLVIYSPDYMSRVWCYTELFTWLCKVREVGATYNRD
jgi:hypothetical protein